MRSKWLFEIYRFVQHFPIDCRSTSEIGGISFTDMQEFHQAWVLGRMRVEIAGFAQMERHCYRKNMDKKSLKNRVRLEL